MHARTYGAIARIGIATPQANPTVEPELARLFPEGVSMLVARSVSTAEPRQRLLDYFTGLEQTLAQFGGLQLDAFGFACTASSYLLEEGVEAAGCQALSGQISCPVVTAAAASELGLQALRAQRLAIASPYPQWIHEACIRHWQRRGFKIVAHCTTAASMVDTTDIYSLDPYRAAERIAADLRSALLTTTADALLLTGTGMPTLPVIPLLQAQLGLPVLSSNLCLAWACLRAAGVATSAVPICQDLP
jgi:maleate isomerase